MPRSQIYEGTSEVQHRDQPHDTEIKRIALHDTKSMVILAMDFFIILQCIPFLD